jgi:hypothetical protein
MTHAYTDNQIIQFIYKECDLFQRLEMEFAMEDDSTLMETHDYFRNALNELPKVHFNPRKETVNRILQYSMTPSF